MLGATIFMAVLSLALLLVAYFRGGTHFLGLQVGLKMFIGVLPLLIFAFVVAGLAQVLIPKEFIVKWLGREAGIKGILIGCFAGALTPGGPYVSFPVVASFYKAGAGIGAVVGYLTAWSVWQLTRLPLEIGLVGLRPALIRYACTLIVPPLAGLLAHYIFS
ncbi:MAG: permease [Candidatus Margulisiibacteriota bacterium]